MYLYVSYVCHRYTVKASRHTLNFCTFEALCGAESGNKHINLTAASICAARNMNAHYARVPMCNNKICALRRISWVRVRCGRNITGAHRRPYVDISFAVVVILNIEGNAGLWCNCVQFAHILQIRTCEGKRKINRKSYDVCAHASVHNFYRYVVRISMRYKIDNFFSSANLIP